VQRDGEAYKRAMTAVDNQILDLLPKIKEAKQTVDLLNRVTMSFDVVLEKGADHVPKVMVFMFMAFFIGVFVERLDAGSCVCGVSTGHCV